MTTLPIRRIILYKHGVGYFERRGPVSGESLRLAFPRTAMDDVLKSLVALDLGAGQVLSVDFETPEDRAALLAKGSIHLSDNRSMLDLLRDLRGRAARFTIDDDMGGETTVEGLVVGVDYEDEQPLRRAAVSVYEAGQRIVRAFPLEKLLRLDLLDDAAAADLGYFLRAAQSEEERRSATLHLSPGDHELLVGYIAPAPAWRVSYRMLYEEQRTGPALSEAEGNREQDGADAQAVPGSLFSVLLQGWGLFDNQLEEDLEQVALTLVAGMPVSFRYRLYEPKTPERPLVEDEERTVSAPVFFAGAPPPPPAAMPQQMKAMRAMAMDADGMVFGAAAPEAPPSFSISEMDESVQVSATGAERGALFAYSVGHPVSVARGQSAMVPILSAKLPCRRELLYNGAKLPEHPVASLRLNNDTGLTLERGPVTVLENGDYAGEAVVPFTRAGAELIVPYAVELGIKVEEQRASERRVAAIRIRGDYLLIQEFHIQRTTYHLTSTLAQAVDVVVEHSLLQNYELTDTPEPAERAAGFGRWPVACAPNARTVFAVRERTMTERHEAVRSITGAQLQAFLKQRFLDEAAVKALQGVLELYRQAAEIQQRNNQIERERQAIYKQQQQIQGNLTPLGREGEEGALRKRYVAELNSLEDQLKALAAEEQQNRGRIAELERQASARLKELAKQ